MSSDNGGGAGGPLNAGPLTKGVTFSNAVTRKEYNIENMSNLDKREPNEFIGYNVLSHYMKLPTKRMEPTPTREKGETREVRNARLMHAYHGVPPNEINRRMRNYKTRVAISLDLRSLIKRLEQNTGVEITDREHLMNILSSNPRIATKKERQLLSRAFGFNSTRNTNEIRNAKNETMRRILSALRASEQSRDYAHEFAQRHAAINVNEAGENVNRFMKGKFANTIRNMPINSNRRRYFTRKQGKYFGKKGGGIRGLSNFLIGAPRGVGFSDVVTVEEYRKPRMENILAPAEPGVQRVFAPNITRNVLDYHASIRDPSNPYNPGELDSTVGHSPGTMTRGEGPITRYARQGYMAHGLTGNELEAHMANYKKRFGQRLQTMTNIRDVQERTGKTEYGTNNIGDMVTTAIEYNDVLDPAVVNRLLAVENENLNATKAALNNVKGQGIVANRFAREYARLNFNENNTDETLRAKFQHQIRDFNPVAQTLLMQRFDKAHAIRARPQ